MPLYLLLIWADFNCLGNLFLLNIFDFNHINEIFQSRSFSYILIFFKEKAWICLILKVIRINLLRLIKFFTKNFWSLNAFVLLSRIGLFIPESPQISYSTHWQLKKMKMGLKTG